MKEIILFDWQKEKPVGILKAMNKILYIEGSSGKPRKVRPLKDDAGIVWIKNPYNINHIKFLDCSFYRHGDFCEVFGN
jgi:hypothetical protein